ncbi:MAG: thioredoxin family protein [Nitrososphaeraceae archaeon]
MSINITTSEWNSLTTNKDLIAADFWAPWCPYCIKLGPIFESVAKDYQNIKFVKINVQEESQITSRYGIQGIPVIKFFCEGREVGEVVGYVPERFLRKKIEEIAKNAATCLTNTSANVVPN